MEVLPVDGRHNPAPLSELDLAWDAVVQNALTHEKLCEEACTDELEHVTTLSLNVDTSEMSMGDFGRWLPSLRELRLSGSFIGSVRDLGTSLAHVRVLWLSRCGLGELEGMTSFRALEELYVAFNEISDLSALAMVDTLRVLDLEANNVDDIEQVAFLGMLGGLTALTLSGNPIQDTQPEYRAAVVAAVPSLALLDDLPASVVTSPAEAGAADAEARAEERAIQASIKSFGDFMGALDDDERQLIEAVAHASPSPPRGPGPGARPQTSAGPRTRTRSPPLRQHVAERPASRRRPRTPGTGYAVRPGSSRGYRHRPSSGTGGTGRPATMMGRPMTASGWGARGASDPDAWSSLTAGAAGTMVGNPVLGLRKRRKMRRQQQQQQTQPQDHGEPGHLLSTLDGTVQVLSFDTAPSAATPASSAGAPLTRTIVLSANRTAVAASPAAAPVATAGVVTSSYTSPPSTGTSERSEDTTTGDGDGDDGDSAGEADAVEDVVLAQRMHQLRMRGRV